MPRWKEEFDELWLNWHYPCQGHLFFLIKKNIVYNLIQNSYVTRNIALGVRKEFVGFDALMTHGQKGN